MLAWHDPATGEHIPTFESERARADQARAARLPAEAEFRAMREARIAAEESASPAEARIHQLEEKLRRRNS